MEEEEERKKVPFVVNSLFFFFEYSKPTYMCVSTAVAAILAQKMASSHDTAVGSPLP